MLNEDDLNGLAPGFTSMRWKVLPYDYARCWTQDCPLEETCMRKTPGHPTYQTVFHPNPSKDCDYYIHKEEDDEH
jgi:hypothetical protein